MTEKNSQKGKKNRASGADFERRTRKDLEEKGWIVSKWSNNLEMHFINETWDGDYKIIPSKHKFRGAGIPMAIGTGFPDFIAYRFGIVVGEKKFGYEIIGVECKVNGYLSKEEKEKCQWLLENKVFSKILIASKEKLKGRIKVNYKEFK